MKIFDYANLSTKRIRDYVINDITPEDDGIQPIFEATMKLSIGDVLIVNNVAYYVCSTSVLTSQHPHALVKKCKEQSVFAKKEEPKEQNRMCEITCPYCGGEETNSWEAEDEGEEYICGCCSSTFSYQRNVIVNYDSQPIKKADVKLCVSR